MAESAIAAAEQDKATFCAGKLAKNLFTMAEPILKIGASAGNCGGDIACRFGMINNNKAYAGYDEADVRNVMH